MNNVETAKHLPRLSVGRDYRQNPHQDVDNIIEIMQGNLCIGRVHCGIGPDDYELAQRIATLWAAAPSLLEALQAYVANDANQQLDEARADFDAWVADTDRRWAAAYAEGKVAHLCGNPCRNPLCPKHGDVRDTSLDIYRLLHEAK